MDLGAISAATEGFTGADLQAIVYTAQLSSLEFLLGDSQVGCTGCHKLDAPALPFEYA